MRELPDRTTLDPAAPPGMEELSGGGSVVGIVAAAGAHRRGTAAAAAAGMAAAWSAGGIRLILADGSLAEPKLHDALGIENGEGISDALVFGSSLRRVARTVDGQNYFAVAAGTVVADPSHAMAAGRWSLLCEGFRAAGVMLAVYLNAEDASTALALREASHVVVVAEEADEIPAVVSDCAAPVLAVIGVEAEAPVPAPVEDMDVAEAPETEVEEALDFGGVAGEIAAGEAGSGAEDEAFDFGGITDEVPALEAGAGAEEEAFDFGGLASEISAAQVGSGADEEDFDFGGITDEVPALGAGAGAGKDTLDVGGVAGDIGAGDDSAGAEEEAFDFGGLANEIAATGAAPAADEPALLDADALEADALGAGALNADALDVGAPAGGVAGSGVGAGVDEEPFKVMGIADEAHLAVGPDMGAGRPARPAPMGGGLDGGLSPSRAAPGAKGGVGPPYQPLRTRPRRPAPEPAKTRPVFLVAIVVIGALVAADWFGYVEIPGFQFGPPAVDDSGFEFGGGPPAQATPGETLEPADNSPLQGYSVAMAAFPDINAARSLAGRVRAAVPDVLVLVVPAEVNGQTYHRVLVGPAEDTSGASTLLARIASATRRDASTMVIRETPRAFELLDTEDLAAARERVDSLTAMGVPAYLLTADYSDGSRRYRVYAGAYSDDADASLLSAYLTDNGVDAGNLVDRKGRLPE